MYPKMYPKTLAIPCLLLVFTAHHNLHADDAGAPPPKIKVAWKQSLEVGFVTLIITNNSDASIKVSPGLTVALRDTKPNSTWPEDPYGNESPGYICAKLEFVPPPGKLTDGGDFYGGDGGRLYPPMNVLIKPGETKEIKFTTIPKRILSAVSDSLEADLTLKLNGNEIHKTVLKKKDREWSE